VARDGDSVTFRMSLPSATRAEQTKRRTKTLAEVSACMLIPDGERPARRADGIDSAAQGCSVIAAGNGDEGARVF